MLASLLVTSVLAAAPSPTLVFDENAARPLERERRLVIYLNGDGVTLTNGYSNSSENTSPLAAGPRTLEPSGLPDRTWAELLSCVREAFGPYNATVTDRDPGAAHHVELVVSASSTPLGFAFPVSGIAPFSCDGVDRAIAYTFVDATGGSVRNLCWTAVQEIGHTLGLEHALLCGDPMTYLFGCPNATFQDTDAWCGEDEPRACECGNEKQNSHAHLRALLGAGDTVPPVLEVTYPADGEEVAAGFTLRADARDPYAVTRVKVELDGVEIGEDVTAPFEIIVPARAGAGRHRLRTIARDAAGNTAVDEREIEVRAECATEADCSGTEVCTFGVCLAELGAACSDDGACFEGHCRGDGDRAATCRPSCLLGDDSTCPSGETCEFLDGASVCMPAPPESSGCSAASHSSSATLAVGAWLSLLVRRRKRQQGTP